ncbi:MAG: chromosomal replication initiator protein DnaA [Clostridia bacterium]|nr:chromosomal replication initiator protein DnaA [Clostridia bacterium]
MPYLDDITELWNSVKESFSDTLTRETINLWFGNIRLEDYDSDTGKLTMTTDSEFKHDIITKKYLSTIEKQFSDLLGFGIKVDLKYRKKENTDTPEDPPAKTPEEPNEGTIPPYTKDPDNPLAKTPEDPYGGTRPPFNFKYTFENFIVGSSNKFAHAACLAVAENPATNYNPLFIYGPSGIGKTHLLYAITNKVNENKPDVKIIFITGEDFTNQFIEAMAINKTQEFRNKYRQCDILLIDDIHFIAGKVSTQEEFFNTFNALYEDRKQIILTSDRPPREMKTLEERLKTRFEWGLLADIQPPDLELRIAIIKNKAEQIGITLSEEVLTFLAENLRSNVRQIEGAIKKLGAKFFVEGNDITIESAKACVADLLDGQIPTEVTVSKIFGELYDRYGVTKEELTGLKRSKEIVNVRHIAVYLIRKNTDMSQNNIAKIFNRDHTTVIASLEKVEKQMKTDSSYKAEINRLIKDIES